VTRWFGCSLSVSDPFVCRCLTSGTMVPSSHPAHRTGRADLPHPALGEKVTMLHTGNYVLFPFSSVSSTGASSHILIRCSIAPSTIRRAKLNSPAHEYLCLRFKRHLAMSPARLEARMDSLPSFPLHHAGLSRRSPSCRRFLPEAFPIKPSDNPSGVGQGGF